MVTHCPICNSDQLTLYPKICTDYITGKSFQLLHCQSCQCYTTQGEIIGDIYGQIYYNTKKGKFTPWLEKIFRWNHRRNAYQFYRRFKPQTVLEIGCGRAYILRELKQLGCEVYCVESEQAADWIRQNPEINVVTPDETGELPFSDNYFQLIILWHVFEHLPEPVTTLRQLTRLLASGDVICISVPNASSLQARLNLVTWFHLDVPRHLFHFSREGLLDLLQREGYEIINVQAGDLIQNLYGWFQSLANLLTPKTLNGLYRFLQGGKPLQTANKWAVFLQIITVFIWLPLGIIGCVIASLAGKPATITVYAKKRKN